MRLVMCLLVLLSAPAMAQSGSILGEWIGPEDPDGNRSTIEVFPCADDRYCGRVSAVTLASADILLNQVILLDLQQVSEAKYTGGRIRFDHLQWRFSSTVQMRSHDRLDLRACWAFVVCQTLPYERVSSS